MSVLILLPLELISHYSEIISGAIVRTVEYDISVKEPELLTAITKPLTQKIVQLDKVVLDLLAQNKTKGGKWKMLQLLTLNTLKVIFFKGETLLKHVCKKTVIFTIDENGVNSSKTLIEKCNLNSFFLVSINLFIWI